MNIVECIRQANADFCDSPAVVEGERVHSYGELFERVAELRQVLRENGVGAGCRVAFHCEDGFAYIAGALALLESGAAVVPVATSLTAAEARATVERMDVTGMLSVRPDFGDGLPGVGEAMELAFGGRREPVFFWRARTPWRPPPYQLRELAAAFIRFSSGTTGASKGVVLSHDSIWRRTAAADRGLRVRREDRILWVLSMSHHFVVSILLFLRKGATIVIGHRDFPHSIADVVNRGEITFVYAAPFHYHLLATDQTIAADGLRTVRLTISTAMKMPTETAALFQGKFGFAPVEAYGIIEVGLPFIDLAGGTGGRPRGCVGRILPDYELCLRNQDRAGVGEVLLRGPGMFDAYYSPWQWREQCLADGWFDTGDLGRLNAAGELELVGRRKTVIVCAGMKVFPEEVEEVVNLHPGVRESLVFGVEHRLYGQIPQAAVVLDAEFANDEKNLLNQLRRHCYGSLSSYKVPKEFRVVEALPKTASGKLARHPRALEAVVA